MLPALEYLLKHLEDLRRIYKDDVWIQIRIDAAWDKLNKYYNKTDDTMAYMAATVLNPLYKWKYFEGVWTEDVLKQWLRQGKQTFRAYWEANYAGFREIAACLHGQDRPLRDELELYLSETCLLQKSRALWHSTP